MKRVGVLTAGGDCPGLNAAIRAVTRKTLELGGIEVLGIVQGWKGLLEAESIPLTRDNVGGLLIRGGTILGSTPSHTFDHDVRIEDLVSGYHRMGLDALIVIGGDSTLGVARRLHQAGLNVVGIPKTIDNDIVGTERTIGFNTAVTVAVEAIDRVHTTAESHNRVMIVEVMGRHAGWIAVVAGLAGGADIILIPEKPFDLDAVCDIIRERHRIRSYTIIVVAEGAHEVGGDVRTKDEVDTFGYATIGGVGSWLKSKIMEKMDYDARVIILGHTQRGGTPTVEDRVIATRFGVKAAELVSQGRYGCMVALRQDDIIEVGLEDTIGERRVDDYWYDTARVFFG
jgi:ATP-dependent phosphofructokinase / diphosphate-dependent phosphofructokinase